MPNTELARAIQIFETSALCLALLSELGCVPTPEVKATSAPRTIPTLLSEVPTSTLPNPTETALPRLTETPAVPTLPDFLKALQSDATKEVDLTAGVAWDKATGLVYAAKDAKGEWVSYPDGNVPIPPGPGQEGPALEVPLYHTTTDAMYAVTKELPWGDPGAYAYRANQWTALKKEFATYWNTLLGGTQKHVDAPMLDKPTSLAGMSVLEVTLTDGTPVTFIDYASSTTKYYFKPILVREDVQTVITDLKNGIPGPTAVKP